MSENVLLESHLKTLKLPTFLANYRKFATEAAQAGHSYDRFLLALAEQEIAQRKRNRTTRRINGARFPVLKELADFDFSCISSPSKQRIAELAQGSFIGKAESIIMVGNPGLGKTHLATSIALAACRKGLKVRFCNAAALVNELSLAQDERRLSQLITSLLKYRLIVMDELGFIPLSTNGAHVMFQLCSALYERVATIVTTNLRFAEWTKVFGDEQLTAALLDRLTHHAHILEFIGESYRFRERMQREAAEAAD
jgi:DNA replication protein DnaC